MEKKTVYLLDGTNLLYRAFFAIRMLNSPSGQPSNAVYGMAAMLLKLIEDYKPDGVVVAFDKGRNTFRNQLYSEYKGTRQETPVELSEQFEPAKEFIRLLGIPILDSDEYEADDIIGTLARAVANTEGWKARIVSGDKDLLQLIDAEVEMLLVRKGMTDVEVLDIPAFQEIYGITPDVFVEVKALMGDSSDNIPGVPGVGEKTALKLIKEYGNLVSVYENVEQISGKKLQENLRNNKDKAELSLELSRICCTMPLDFDLNESINVPDWENVRSFFERFGLKSLVKKIPVVALENSVGGGEVFQGQLNYEKSLPKNFAQQVQEAASENNPLVVVPVLKEAFPRQNWGSFGVYWQEKLYFISNSHKDWGQLLRLMSREDVVKATWRAKDFYRSAFSYEYEFAGLLLDARIGGYLLKPGEGGLDEKSVWEEYGEGTLPMMPEDSEEKSIWLALLVGKVYPEIRENLVKIAQWELFVKLETPLAKTLAELEWNGIQVDVEKMQEMSAEFSKRIKESREKIYESAGEAFNVNSPKQLGTVLFEKLRLPILKKTKTGPSTDMEVLEELASQHPVVKELVNYRHLTKLQSTYLDALPTLIDSRTGRLHTTFHQTVTATGRLSSANPNLQNIPVRTEEGKRIRYFFVPGVGYDGIFSADYSQIELRILAHISQDESMQKAFLEGEDIHTRTAAEVFGVSRADVTREMRSHAKAVNFGIVYGISDYSLSKDIGVTRKEAAEYMEKYFARYPKIKSAIDQLVETARECGYSETLDGRRRYIPDIKSSNYNRRSFAERIAMNMPIQGTAADIIKKAMIWVQEDMKAGSYRSRMVLQVHDELVFEYVESELVELEKIVQNRMEQAASLAVPLKVDIAVGPNWAEAK